MIVHPLAFAASYVVGLWFRNLEELDLLAVVRPLVLALGVTTVAWLIATKLLGDVRRGAFATSAWLVLAFQFGAVLEQLGRRSGDMVAGSSVPALQHGLAVGAVVLWGAAVWVVNRRETALAMITTFLNAASLVWLVAPASIVLTRSPAVPSVDLPPVAHAPAPGGQRPNVFYIILDAYGRSDVLKTMYDYDNRPFLDALARKGFHVAERSRANYAQTSLSLASSLNMTYLDDVSQAVGVDATNRRPLVRLIDDNRLVRFLRAAGYRFVWFSSGVSMADLRTPDVVLSTPGSLSEFENLLLSMSAFPYWWQLLRQLPGGAALPDQFDAHRARVRHVLDGLPEQAATAGPVFVLAHILSPHPPFVFEEDGARPAAIPMGPYDFFNDGVYSRTRAAYHDGYRKQVAFVTRELEAAIDGILARSPSPPIIVVQGDHGPGSMWNPIDSKRTNLGERFPILNAYYFPRRDYQDIPNTITPVNSFRLVLSRYFGANLPLLEDRSYFASWNAPYRFEEVTDAIQ